MKFPCPLEEAVLIRRYKRFLADFRLADGSTLTLHCPNTGSMRNCGEAGDRVWYSRSASRGRKYPHTWELVEVTGEHLVGINTLRANALVKEAIESEVISQLRDYERLRSEVAMPAALLAAEESPTMSGGESLQKKVRKSRLDFLLEEPTANAGTDPCYVEVKSVTLGMGEGLGLFPDAVTSRGLRHLQELMRLREAGFRAVLLFCVQHSGITTLRPADEIDAAYGQMLRQAAASGVEVLAYGAELDPEGITLRHELPVLLD